MSGDETPAEQLQRAALAWHDATMRLPDIESLVDVERNKLRLRLAEGDLLAAARRFRGAQLADAGEDACACPIETTGASDRVRTWVCGSVDHVHPDGARIVPL